MVSIRYYLYGENTPLAEVKKGKADFGGYFVIQPPANLPSGARFRAEIGFLRAGNEIGRLSREIFFETEKRKLTAGDEEYSVKTGFLRKTWYHRLRVQNASDLSGKVGVQNRFTGCVCYDISWFEDGGDCVSWWALCAGDLI